MDAAAVLPATALRLEWPAADATAHVDAGTNWFCLVQLRNISAAAGWAQGAPLAAGELSRDGQLVRSRQQGWPMPAILRRWRLPAGGAVLLPVSVRLLTDEMSDLAPGRYTVSATWAGLTAPPRELEIRLAG